MEGPDLTNTVSGVPTNGSNIIVTQKEQGANHQCVKDVHLNEKINYDVSWDLR